MSLNCGHRLLFIPQVMYEYGELQWNDIDSEIEELEEKPVPVPLFQPKIPHGLTRERTQAFAVKGRQLTARAMAIFIS
jgi:hypothetical protein